jgi:hypothetical protein
MMHCYKLGVKRPIVSSWKKVFYEKLKNIFLGEEFLLLVRAKLG